LAAGKVDAATAFWNAEGVTLRQQGIPIREFRVDQFGAPHYPELVVATTPDRCDLARDLTSGLNRGYEGLTPGDQSALGALLGAVPDLSRPAQGHEFYALMSAHAFAAPNSGGAPSAELLPGPTRSWVGWAAEHSVISPPAQPKVSAGFAGCG
jgi:hypothetical protein